MKFVLNKLLNRPFLKRIETSNGFSHSAFCVLYPNNGRLYVGLFENDIASYISENILNISRLMHGQSALTYNGCPLFLRSYIIKIESIYRKIHSKAFMLLCSSNELCLYGGNVLEFSVAWNLIDGSRTATPQQFRMQSEPSNLRLPLVGYVLKGILSLWFCCISNLNGHL